MESFEYLRDLLHRDAIRWDLVQDFFGYWFTLPMREKLLDYLHQIELMEQQAELLRECEMEWIDYYDEMLQKLKQDLDRCRDTLERKGNEIDLLQLLIFARQEFLFTEQINHQYAAADYLLRRGYLREYQELVEEFELGK